MTIVRSVLRWLLPISIAALAPACTAPSSNEGTTVGEQNARTFLDPSSYADLVYIDPSFPFGVTRKQAAAGAVLGATWGNHGGPVATMRGSGRVTRVARWSIGGAATAAATKTELSVATASDLPAQRFWGADGVVDLPFGDLAMQGYTTAADAFAGEILFYGNDYGAVVGRAHVNGFYAGVGLVKGDSRRIVYSGLSKVASSPVSSNESGLYAADVCGASLVPSAACAPHRLFGWTGSSGPVVKDSAGNVFVAAFVPGGPQSDVVYGITNAQAMSATEETPATVASLGTSGTASLAAALPSGSTSGWLVGKGYDGEDTAPLWARRYTASDAIAATGEVVAKAVSAVDSLASLSLFSDGAGDLWIAVDAPDGRWFLQLAPKP